MTSVGQLEVKIIKTLHIISPGKTPFGLAQNFEKASKISYSLRSYS
jgi:hypothetical protein